jgi:hypothetical protein
VDLTTGTGGLERKVGKTLNDMSVPTRSGTLLILTIDGDSTKKKNANTKNGGSVEKTTVKTLANPFFLTPKVLALFN